MPSETNGVLFPPKEYHGAVSSMWNWIFLACTLLIFMFEICLCHHLSWRAVGAKWMKIHQNQSSFDLKLASNDKQCWYEVWQLCRSTKRFDQKLHCSTSVLIICHMSYVVSNSLSCLSDFNELGTFSKIYSCLYVAV